MAKAKKVRGFTLAVEKSLDGGFVGYVEELPGCATQGETMEELEANARKLIPDFIDAMISEYTQRAPQKPRHNIIRRKTLRARPLEMLAAR